MIEIEFDEKVQFTVTEVDDNGNRKLVKVFSCMGGDKLRFPSLRMMEQHCLWDAGHGRIYVFEDTKGNE